MDVPEARRQTGVETLAPEGLGMWFSGKTGVDDATRGSIPFFTFPQPQKGESLLKPSFPITLEDT